MANETATKSKRFYCVSLLPDICKTPIGPSTPPIPYSVIGEFSQATNESPNVKAHSEPVILHNRSVIPTVKGDETGTAGGIKSGTCGKKVETKTASKTYFANGTATVQVGCEVWMNNRNTIGKIYERGGIAPRTRLQQIAALANETLDEAIHDARTALRPAAMQYKEGLSELLHDAAGSAMDKGGKVAMSGMAVAGTGAAATATGVGAPVGVPMTAIGTVGTAAGGTVTAVGVTLDTGATLLDYAADFILSNKTPDLKSVAMELGQGVLTGTVGNKLPMLKPVFGKGKVGTKSSSPPPSLQRPPDKAKGGKTNKKKEKKSDKPSECCPKNKAPGGKAVSSRHPVHFGTGEEVLYQTDFIVEGPIPLEWVRCYRSGSELEDWGLLGARWGTPFTASIAVTAKGLVYVDDSGRPMMLPALAPGAAFDNRKEGFTLTRSGESEFIVEWRDGSTEKFVRTPSADSWLPHGYEGVNAMRHGGEPLIAERYTLSQMQGRDGRGVTIDRFPEAQPGQVLMRVRSDEGQVIEALRDDSPQMLVDGSSEHARIGRVEEVRSDGIRVCHVRYEYAAETAAEILREDAGDLPTRYNLVRQTNLVGSERRYEYRHHLLASYTTYTGFAHTLQWISLAALRARWRGNAPPPDDALIALFPVTLENSYQARAIATATADGLDGVRINYLDEDTTRVIDANGGVLEYVFDANWLAIEVRRVDATGNASSLGRRVWDSDGMLLAEIDAIGRTTRYTYDSAGNLVTITDALDRSSRIKYDGRNQPVAITDPLGHTTRREYDKIGNTTAHIDALGHTTSFCYDDRSRLVSQTDAKGGNKKIRYDAAGRLVSYEDCSGYPTRYEYDAAGHVVAVIDALNQVMRYTYDSSGNMTSVCQADGTNEQYAYDAAGNLTLHKDAAGYETRYRYNGHGLPIERIDALGHTVQYHYDALLQLNELINANGERFCFTYNADGFVTSETGFDGRKTAYSYNLAGQIVESDCAGNKVQLFRDVLGQLIAKQTADGVHRYAYDALGRIAVVVAPYAQNHFTFDALGRLIEERSTYFLTSTEIGQIGPRKPDANFAMSHSYDELGNHIQTVLPNGRCIETLRYGAGHWHGTLLDGQTVVDIERDRLHREQRRRFGAQGQVTAVREFDPQSRVTRMRVHRNDEQPLRDRKYRYDANGNLLEIVSGGHAYTGSLDTYTYSYDPLGQLLESVRLGLTEKFAFDPAGNLIDSSTTTEKSTSESKCRPHVARLTRNLLMKFNDCRYEYDIQGNVIKKHQIQGRSADRTATLELQYDAERQVRTVRFNTGNSAQAHYFYDGFGRRIAKRVTTGNHRSEQSHLSTDRTRSPKTILFVWNGDNLVQEFQSHGSWTYLYEPETSIPLAMVATSVPDTSNQSLPQLSPIEKENSTYLLDEYRFNRSSDEQIYNYNCDHIGTPKELFNSSGATVWHDLSNAWGKQEANQKESNPAQSLRFPGQYYDEESGLHYNRHRYYDPDAGRYLTQDPIGIAGGLNPYQYAPNPIGWTDPLGLTKCPIAPLIPITGNSARKLLKARGLSRSQANDLISSFDGELYVRNGRAGDIFNITESTPGSASGVFVTRGSAGQTQLERVSKLALPPCNTAEYERKISLARDQLLIEGKVAPQLRWGSDKIGGGWQVVTAGGKYTGAVK